MNKDKRTEFENKFPEFLYEGLDTNKLWDWITQYVEEEVRGERERIKDDLEKLIDKDTARLLCDRFQEFNANNERCCGVCGYNPERQRELILNSLTPEVKEGIKSLKEK